MPLHLKKENEGIYILQLDDTNHIEFCPDRGGLITKWICNSESILYFDKKRFLDKGKSVRGGIPILFPICGSLSGPNSIFNEDLEPMPQHGFARDLKWEHEINIQNNSLNFFLVDNSTTKKYYPYKFEVDIRVTLGINKLDFEIIITNKSNTNMPINFGLHPYFNISSFNNIIFPNFPKICQNQTNNTLINTSDLLKNIHQGIDLLIYSTGESLFRDYEFKREIAISHPYPFDINVIWSDPPRKMICIEPWTSPRNSLVDGIRRIDISPSSSQRLFTSIKVKKFE